MSFLAPAFFALSLLAGIVIALHMERRRSVDVGSLMLWRRVASAQTTSIRRWQSLPLSLTLFLQIGAVLALALALAQPLWNPKAHFEHAIYVLDGSSYMQMGSDGDTSFAAALDRISSMAEADAVAATTRFSVVFAGVVPDIVLARQGYSAGIERALRTLSADDGEADWAGASQLVDALMRPGEIARITVVSAGNIPPEFEDRGAPVILEQVDTGNSGRIQHVVQAQLEPLEASEGRWKVAGTVATNSAEASGELSLRLRFIPEGSDSPVDWARVSAAEGRARPEADGRSGPRSFQFSHALTLPGAGVLIVEMEVDDAATLTNVVRLPVPARAQSLDVLYVGADVEPIWRRTIEAIDGAILHTFDDVPEDSARYALAFVDGVAVSRPPATNTIWAGKARLAPAAEPKVMTAPDPVAWRTSHILGEDMDWASLKIMQAFEVAAQEAAVILLEAEQAPLVQAWTDANGRQLQIAFDPVRSNWSGRASFPALINRFVRWSGLPTSAYDVRACSVGLPCSVDARLIQGEIIRLDGDMPDSLPFDLAAQAQFSQDGRFVPTKAGLYLLSNQVSQQLLAINPAPAVLQTIEVVDEEVTRPFAFWWIAALIALVILVVEAILAFKTAWRTKRNAVVMRAGVALLVLVAILVPSLELPRLQEHVVAIDTQGKAWPKNGNVFLGQKLALVQGGTPLQVRRDFDGGESGSSESAAAGLENALLLASAMLPSGTGRLIVSEDGITETTDLHLAIGRLRQRRISVDRIPFTESEGNRPSARVERVEVPSQVYEGDDILLTAVIVSAADMEAELSFFRDGELLTRQPVTFKRGHNRVETLIEAIGPGTTLYEVAVAGEAVSDTPATRNGVAITPTPTGPVAILVTEAELGTPLADALAQEGIESRILTPSRYPAYMKDWLRYRTAVLLNVPARALTTAQQELLETAVKDHGLGLVLIGGDKSFGPGGYLETPIDRLSPLSSDIPGEMPEAALVFVLDRSGSMQQAVENSTRLDIAKQATLSAIQRLNPHSSIAVVVFDDTAQTVVPLQRVEEAQTLDQQLAGFGPGGGTAIYPALEEAFAQLRNSQAMMKHVVVMTDGLTQPADFTSLVTRMRAEGITISTVAIGTGAAIPIVDHIARLGGGNFHTTTDFASLPSILAQEATMFSAAPVEEGLTQPFWTAPRDSYFNLLPPHIPPIDGFVLTSPKPAANVVLMTPDTDGEPMPLLAHWRYGNGQVLALTTDATGAWSRRWQDIESYAAFWVEAIRFRLSSTQGQGMDLRTERHGDAIEIRLLVTDEDGLPSPGLSARASVGNGTSEQVLVLTEESPGSYRGRFVAAHQGTFNIAVETEVGRSETAVHVAYPARLDASSSAKGILTLTRQTGGVTLTSEAAIFGSSAWHWTNTVIWPILLIAALLLFILELLVRYSWRPRHLVPRRVRNRP